MTCCSGSSVSSAVGDDEAGLLLVLLDGRVGREVLLELLVRQVGQDLLAVGADHGSGAARRPSGGSLLGGGLLGGGLRGLLRRLGRGLRGRLWRRPSWRRLLGGLLGRAPSWRRGLRRSAATRPRAFFEAAGSRRTQRRDALPLRWASSALRCRGSTAASSLAWRTSSGVMVPVGGPAR